MVVFISPTFHSPLLMFVVVSLNSLLSLTISIYIYIYCIVSLRFFSLLSASVCLSSRRKCLKARPQHSRQNKRASICCALLRQREQSQAVRSALASRSNPFARTASGCGSCQSLSGCDSCQSCGRAERSHFACAVSGCDSCLHEVRPRPVRHIHKGRQTKSNGEQRRQAYRNT